MIYMSNYQTICRHRYYYPPKWTY